jgi:hypothetical protein
MVIASPSTTSDDGPKRKAHKLQPIRIGILLQKIVDVSIVHPLRYHDKPILGHRHTQQGQHIRMTKGPPRHNLSTKPLYGSLIGSLANTMGRGKPTLLIRTKSLVKNPPSGPSTQLPGQDVDLSTRLQTHQNTLGSQLYRSKAGICSAFRKQGLDGHKS